MITGDILQKPIQDIVGLIRARLLSPVELIHDSIARTKSIHRSLNVLVEERFNSALAEADRLERAISRGENLDAPLLGIPFSAKASISVEGLRLDMGSWSMHGNRASQSATVVQRLQKAGAILLGTTNLSEMGLWHDTVNPIYGRTLNPWKSSRIVGGSSGGEAALVASGGTLFGIASDLEGSLRIPAAFCGTFAHRPSRGLVPLTGQYPFFRPEDEIPWRAIDSVGPITRHAKDLAVILRVIAGPCNLDPMSMTGSLNEHSTDIQHRTIGFIENPHLPSLVRTAPEVRLAMHKVRRRLLEAGVKVIDAPRDLFYQGFVLWRSLVQRATGGRLHRSFGALDRRKSLLGILKCLTGQADHTLASSMLMLMDHLYLRPEQLRSLDADLGSLRRRIEMNFKQFDALVIPTYPEVAPQHTVGTILPLNLGLTSLVNALGLSSSQAPVSLSAQGLPIGAQCITKHGDDLLAIQLAEVIGEYIPPPLSRSIS